MNAINIIKNSKKVLSKNEIKIADFILNNLEDFILMSIKDLSLKINVSEASISRFSKKIGFKNLKHLKMEIAQNIGNQNNSINILDSLETANIFDLTNTFKNKLNDTLNETIQLLDNNKFNEAILRINNSDTIYLFGIGASGLICQDLQNKLVRIGKKAIFTVDAHNQITLSNNVDSNSVVIAISYSGKTLEIIKCLENAKENNAYTIGITTMSKSPIHEYIDCLLQLPYCESKFRIGAIESRNASFFITDLLYLGVLIKNNNAAKNNLIKTKKDVDNLY